MAFDLHSSKSLITAQTLVEAHSFQAGRIEAIIMFTVVLLHERLHAPVDRFAVGHVADGFSQQCTDAAERVTSVEGALGSSNSRPNADEDANATICFRTFTRYTFAVAVAVVTSCCLPGSLGIFSPSFVPCPATWVVYHQGAIHIHVTVDVSLFEESWSG